MKKIIPRIIYFLDGGIMKKKLVLLLFALVANKSVVAMDKGLLEAVRENRLAEVEQLLCKGANPNYVGIHDVTPLYKALVCEHIDVARMLIAHGANVNLPSTNSTTPLMSALLHNANHDFLRKLIWLGAQSDTVGPHNKTAFDFARNKEIKQWLQGEIRFREAFIERLFRKDGLEQPVIGNPSIELPLEIQFMILTKAFPIEAAK